MSNAQVTGHISSAIYYETVDEVAEESKTTSFNLQCRLTEMPAHNAVPSGTMIFVELLLD